MKSLGLRSEAEYPSGDSASAGVDGLLDGFQMGLLSCDSRSGLIEHANATALHLLGQPPERLLGQPFLPLFDLPLRWEEMVRDEARPAAPAHGWLVRPDGVRRPVAVRTSGRPGVPTDKLLIVFEDISRQRRTEEQIRAHATLLEITQDAILVLDSAGRICFWNRGAERLYGWTVEEALGQMAADWLGPASGQEWQEARERTLSLGEWQGELRHITRDQKELMVQSRWTLSPVAMDQPQFILMVNTDITEKKRIEARFWRAQRLESLTCLAGGIAHDLNNELMPIQMGLQVLEAKLPDPASQNLVKVLSACAQKTLEIVKQISAFARGLEGKRGLIQPKHIVRDVLKTIQAQWPKNIQIQNKIPSQTWTLLANPGEIQQVITNLLLQARAAMPNGGQLTVTLENRELSTTGDFANPKAKPGRYVLIRVVDTGQGVDEQTLDKIFDPYSPIASPKGTSGLGLPAVWGIVENHGGFIEVRSQVQKGTEFQVYLPASLETGGDDISVDATATKTIPGH